MPDVTPWLIAGGMFFWLFILAWVVVLTMLVSGDWLIGSLLASVCFAAVLVDKRGFNFDVMTYLPNSWTGWTALVVCWLAIGAGWSVFRFYTYYSKEVDSIAERKAVIYDNWHNSYERVKDVKVYPNKDKDQNSPEWKKYWNDYVDQNVPRPYDYKYKITTWIAWWPFSVIDYVMGDLLHDLLNAIYDYLSGVYERIGKYLRDKIKV